MREFTINRLHNDHGIFRISGHIDTNFVDNDDLEITSLDIMGTDGWMALDVGHPNTQATIKKIAASVLVHLRNVSESS